MVISNYRAFSTDSTFNFPSYRLSVNHDFDKIYYKKRKIFDASFFEHYETLNVELYKNSLLLISDKKIGYDPLPASVKKTEVLLIELDEPTYYYLVKFEKPINLISQEVIELANSTNPKLDTTKQSPFSSIEMHYNYHIINKIDLQNREMVLEKIDRTGNLFQKSNDQKEIKLTLEKHKNPLEEK